MTMVRLRFKMSCTSKAFLGWLVLGMVGVPLLHVHPEADHRHGMPGHVHGGLYHTVFSPELACVNAPHRADEASVSSREFKGDAQVLSQLAHVGDHPAVTFSFLTSKPDSPPDWKAGQSPGASPALLEFESASLPSFLGTTASLDPTFSFLFSTCLSPRAPPVVLSV